MIKQITNLIVILLVALNINAQGRGKVTSVSGRNANTTKDTVGWIRTGKFDTIPGIIHIRASNGRDYRYKGYAERALLKYHPGKKDKVVRPVGYELTGVYLSEDKKARYPVIDIFEPKK